jgi:GMP reductase
MLVFDFKDINLVPKKCIVESRAECSTKVKFGNWVFDLPVVPANMKAVIDEELAVKLAYKNYFYIMHRFGINTLKFIRQMHSRGLYASISLGVNADSYSQVDELVEEHITPEFITIDIAHGHSIKMEKMLKYVKAALPKSFIIAGNVSTKEATRDLDEWGADAIKIGIGPGSVCSTYTETGFGSRDMQASTIRECSKVTNKVLVADGGITEPGDITKSLVMGADMVMIGGMLSGFKDSPGNIITGVKDGRKYKEIYGSASLQNGDKKNRFEGVHKLIPMKEEELTDYLTKLTEALQSSISYAGGTQISDLIYIEWVLKK